MKPTAFIIAFTLIIAFANHAQANHNHIFKGLFSGDTIESHMTLKHRDVKNYHADAVKRKSQSDKFQKALIADALNRNIIQRISVIDVIEAGNPEGMAPTLAVGYVDIEPLFHELHLRDKQLFAEAFAGFIKSQNPDLSLYFLRDGSKIIGSHSQFGLDLY